MEQKPKRGGSRTAGLRKRPRSGTIVRTVSVDPETWNRAKERAHTDGHTWSSMVNALAVAYANGAELLARHPDTGELVLVQPELAGLEPPD